MEINIAGRLIGEKHKPFIVAEVSANHNGSLDRALEIVDEAIKAGADAVKLQTYTADTMTIDEKTDDFMIQDKDSLWAGRSLYDLYEEAHTPWEWHKEIFRRCEERGVICFSSPFDETAVDFLETLNTPAYKVASFEMTDLPLVRKMASTGKPMIISTGLANAEEIEETLQAARDAGCTQICLLHCVSDYPAEPSDYNLKTITDMAKRFGVLLGLSDHTISNTTAIASIALGACVVEKHFTLRRSDGGPDSAFSLEPDELKQLCDDTNVAWQALGSVNYNLKAGEKSNIKFRRSIYAVKDIKKGELLTAESVRRIRPGFGLAPKFYERVLNSVALCDIARGAPIKLDDFK